VHCEIGCISCNIDEMPKTFISCGWNRCLRALAANKPIVGSILYDTFNLLNSLISIFHGQLDNNIIATHLLENISVKYVECVPFIGVMRLSTSIMDQWICSCIDMFYFMFNWVIDTSISLRKEYLIFQLCNFRYFLKQILKLEIWTVSMRHCGGSMGKRTFIHLHLVQNTISILGLNEIRSEWRGSYHSHDQFQVYIFLCF
jgi:hypothetical protein